MEQHIDLVMQKAKQSFEAYNKFSAKQKADFLNAIANALEALGDLLLETAQKETNLPITRLAGERGRTCGQLRGFANLLLEGNWVEASIDTAIPDKQPPKPDLRKMLVPLGPIVVFGASNFPLAYSTAGGDTASALAAGCAVVVKAHPAHLQTSILVHKAIQNAIAVTKMPEHIFQHYTDTSIAAGIALVQHPITAGVGFTGSFTGGKSLFDTAHQRKNPIPVFAEMGSTNPVILFPKQLEANAVSLAGQFAASISLGMGQFCTKPGIFFSLASDHLNCFEKELALEMEKVLMQPMLHTGIANAYSKKMENVISQPSVVTPVLVQKQENSNAPVGVIASVTGFEFCENENLREEVFGPFAMIVHCNSIEEIMTCLDKIKGQLTITLSGTAEDLEANKKILEKVPEYAGRIVFNGVPTGVEVCASMVHGGPYPASTDSRYTAVGIGAIKRWVRPVCFQNCPDHLLPEALQNDNPLKIFRLLNNHLTKDII